MYSYLYIKKSISNESIGKKSPYAVQVFCKFIDFNYLEDRDSGIIRSTLHFPPVFLLNFLKSFSVLSLPWKDLVHCCEY